ncbi:MAG TPA: hypothetical protein ENH82_00580 [bacterium]|nr:hypothetical protein [bacterium]
MSKYLISLYLTCFFFLPLYAPVCEITLAEKFYYEIKGARWEKLDAMDALEKWPEHYGHTQEEIYNIIEKESRFKVYAISGKGGMGLMQLTRAAIESLPDGTRYYRYYMEDGRKVWKMRKRINGTQYHALHKKFIYRPYYNIKIGCQFLRICKNMSRRGGIQTIGRFTFSTNEMAKIYYVAGYGMYNRRLKVVLRYIQ